MCVYFICLFFSNLPFASKLSEVPPHSFISLNV